MTKTEQNEMKSSDSRARTLSVMALVAVVLIGLLLLIAVVAGLIFGIRFNEKLTTLETQQDNFLQNIAQFDEINAGVDERLRALENAQNSPKPQFSVPSFEIQSSISEYDYIDDYISFAGSGTISEDSGNGKNYIVILKQVLLSGGSEFSEPLSYKTITVINGFGEFATYDSGLITEVNEPRYVFEVIGYIEIDQ
jgi:hypothetical protein